MDKKTVLGTLTIVFVVIAVTISIGIGIANYQIDRDINGWKNRAQVSMEPNDMYSYMSKVKVGMESWNMTSGYAALIFKTPDNDMSLIFRTVKQHVEQSQVLTKMSSASPEYQTGLDNLRGSIRELDLHAFGFWSVHTGLFWWFLGIIFWILAVVFGLWWDVAW